MGVDWDASHLLVVLIALVVNNVEELELVDAARGGDNAEPVTELLLLEELLGAGKELLAHGPRGRESFPSRTGT